MIAPFALGVVLGAAAMYFCYKDYAANDRANLRVQVAELNRLVSQLNRRVS